MVLTELWQVDRAFSRVHAGVHYAGDVVIGAVIGATVGDVVGWGCRGGAGANAAGGERRAPVREW
jgi:membrane-associated phospholipid phosphatase